MNLFEILLLIWAISNFINFTATGFMVEKTLNESDGSEGIGGEIGKMAANMIALSIILGPLFTAFLIGISLSRRGE